MKKILDKIDMAYWAIHRGIRDHIFQPVWYRFFGHKHHIIKTKLPPQPWYDADTRMLYSVMEIVTWFVENDQRVWTTEEVEEEVERINKEEDEEYRESHVEGIRNQYKEQEEIRDIWKWWKNYDARAKEIRDALSDWHKYVDDVAKREFEDYEDSHIPLFLKAKEKMNEEEKKEEDRLSNRLHKMEEDLRNEEQEMLKKAIDLRERMWC